MEKMFQKGHFFLDPRCQTAKEKSGGKTTHKIHPYTVANYNTIGDMRRISDFWMLSRTDYSAEEREQRRGGEKKRFLSPLHPLLLRIVVP